MSYIPNFQNISETEALIALLRKIGQNESEVQTSLNFEKKFIYNVIYFAFDLKDNEFRRVDSIASNYLQEIEKLRNESNSKDREIQNLKNEANTKDWEIYNLKVQLQEIQKLNIELDTCKKERDEWKYKHDLLLCNQTSTNQSELVNVLKDEIKLLKDEIDTVRKEKNDLFEKYDKLLHNQPSNQSEIINLLKNELKDYKDFFTECKKDRDEYKQNYNFWKDQYYILKQRYDEIQ